MGYNQHLFLLSVQGTVVYKSIFNLVWTHD